MEEQPAASKRAKVTAACESCRQHKIKCDGSRPYCSACLNASRECQYSTEPLESRAAAFKRKHAHLEERLSAYDELYHLLRTRPVQDAKEILNRIRSGRDVSCIIKLMKDRDLLLQERLVPQTIFRNEVGDVPIATCNLREPRDPYFTGTLPSRARDASPSEDQGASFAPSPTVLRLECVRDVPYRECPFTVAIVASASNEERDKNFKKRKRGGPDEDRKALVQRSPFVLKGKFKTYQTMDLSYTIEPCKRWEGMTRYNSFILNGVKYYNEDFVYVAKDSTIKQRRGTDAWLKHVVQSTDCWVAKVLEIRALDEHHVFARVAWMYWPDELPPNTLDGKALVSNRQSYHGQNELIASNHMSVVQIPVAGLRKTSRRKLEVIRVYGDGLENDDQSLACIGSQKAPIRLVSLADS